MGGRFYQFLSFPKVQRCIDENLPWFEIVVESIDGTEKVLGKASPFFSAFTLKECQSCGKNPYVAVKVALVGNVPANAPLTAHDYRWFVRGSGGPLTPEVVATLVLEEPTLETISLDLDVGCPDEGPLSEETLVLGAPPMETKSSDPAVGGPDEGSLSRAVERTLVLEEPTLETNSLDPDVGGHAAAEPPTVPSFNEDSLSPETTVDMKRPRMHYESIFQQVMKTAGSFLTWRLKDQNCLLEHQREHLFNFMKLWSEFRAGKRANLRGLVVAPTGSGKTVTLVLAPYLAKSRRTLVITPGNDIRTQLGKAFCDPNSCIFKRLGLPDSAAWSSGEGPEYLPHLSAIRYSEREFLQNITADLSIVNIHALRKSSVLEKAKRAGFDLVIIDEAHHVPAATWREVLEGFSQTQTAFLLFTATPTHNGLDLRALRPSLLLDTIEPELSRETAADIGIIRKLQYNTIGEADDDVEQSFQSIAEAIKHGIRSHDKIGASHRHRFHQAIVFVRTIKEANKFVEIYNRSDVANDKREMAMAYTSKTNEKVLASFLEGGNMSAAARGNSFRTIVSAAKLGEGFDHPNVSVVGIARNLQSRKLFDQIVGRAVRLRRLYDDSYSSDPIRTATIITHQRFDTRILFESLQSVTDVLEAEEEIETDRDSTVDEE